MSIRHQTSRDQLLAVGEPVGRNAVGLHRESEDASDDGGVRVVVAAGADGLDESRLIVVQVASRDP